MNKFIKWLKKVEKPILKIASILTSLGVLMGIAYRLGYAKAQFDDSNTIRDIQNQKIEMSDRYNQTIFDLRTQIYELQNELITIKNTCNDEHK